MKCIKLVLIFFGLFGCNMNRKCVESEPFQPYSNAYICLDIENGSRYCMPYSSLRIVTPYNYMKLKLGEDERIKLYCGIRKLSNHEIKKILSKSELPVYKVNELVDKYLVDSIAVSLLDSANFSFDESHFDIRGNVINLLWEKGKVVDFDDYRGKFILMSRKD